MRKLRIGVLAAGIVALIGLGAPLAHATTYAGFDFAGTLRFPPSGYPLISFPSSGTAFVSASTCAGIDLNVSKPGKAPVVAGVCGFGMSGTWHHNAEGVGGHCEAAGGDLAGTFTDSSGNQFNMAGHYEIDGSEFVLTGTATKGGQSGPVVITGEIDWPFVSCLAGIATQATLVASGTIWVT